MATRLAPPSAVVNYAGVLDDAALDGITDAHIGAQFATNVRGTSYAASKASVEALTVSGGARL